MNKVTAPAKTNQNPNTGKPTGNNANQNKNAPTTNQKGATNANNPQQKNAKGQIIVEEEIKPPPPKEKNIERFIYITTYNDSEAMKTLKELFESINQEAFKLKSIKEIYTRTLSHEEQEDNEIDYISGFQLIDKTLRITILEGITGKAMKIIKDRLPKLELNNSNKKVFSDNHLLYNERIYSKFNLCLKFIKLRETLNTILTTYDIYMKATKYKEIYIAFMNLGFILESQTFSEISHANLFPPAESMMLLERKYADILNDEDLTGVHTKPKNKKKRMKVEILEKNTNCSNPTTTRPTHTDNNTFTNIMSTRSDGESNTKSNKVQSKIKKDSLPSTLTSSAEKITKLKPKLDSRNTNFVNYKESQMNVKVDHDKRNKEIIKNMNDKANTKSFCVHQKKKEETEKTTKIDLDTDNEVIYKNYQIESGDNGSKNNNSNVDGSNSAENPVYLYSSQTKNYYADYFDKMRQSFSKDKNNFYTYSKEYLTLSFPMIKNSNVKYDEYIENKKKWFDPNGKDFNIYRQPNKEFAYFPRINNEL